jgi:hypothetical protein
MSLEQLEAARRRVDERKRAAGDADKPTGYEDRPKATEMLGVLLGTDLTVRELEAACMFGRDAGLEAIAAGVEVNSALAMTFGEGVLIGIEYGKALRK